MANFKDSYRLERVYFEKLKSMISILKSFLENETDEKTRAILSNEIDDNGAILLLYRNLGEAWAELADLIQKLRNDLNDLDEKEEAYHDELNERIDEANNYLMALIRALEARMDAVEADLAQMGRLFTYDLTETSGVYSLTESGTGVTFADTVSKLTHVRPHFVSVRNGSKYYLIDTYDLTAETGAVTWSGFEFTAVGEIKETVVTLEADNTVTVTETVTNFAAILSRLTAIETKISNFGDLPSNANAEPGSALVKSNDAQGTNEWKLLQEGAFIIHGVYDPSSHSYTLTHNGEEVTAAMIAKAYKAGRLIVIEEEREIYSVDQETVLTNLYYFPSDIHATFTDDNNFEISAHFIAVYLTATVSPEDENIRMWIRLGVISVLDIDKETGEVIDDFSSLSIGEPIMAPDHYIVLYYYSGVTTNPPTVMNGPITDFSVSYPLGWKVANYTQFSNEKVSFISEVPFGDNISNPYVLSIKKGKQTINGASKSGYVLTFTDFTFTNGALNTRRLFCYDEGVADYTGA